MPVVDKVVLSAAFPLFGMQLYVDENKNAHTFTLKNIVCACQRLIKEHLLSLQTLQIVLVYFHLWQPPFSPKFQLPEYRVLLHANDFRVIPSEHSHPTDELQIVRRRSLGLARILLVCI